MTDRTSGQWNLAFRQQASVAALGQLGLRTTDLDEVLRAALDTVAHTLGVDQLGLLELLPGGHEFTIRAAMHRGAHVDATLSERVRVPAGRESLPGFTVVNAEAVVSEDLLNDERFHARAAEYGLDVVSAVVAPVGWGGAPWGVLAVYSSVVRSWTPDDVHYVQSVANTVGLAIARHRVESELRNSSASLELSLAAGGLGAWRWDPSTDLLELSEAAVEILGVDHRFDGTGDSFYELIEPEDRAHLRSTSYEALQTEREIHSIYRIYRQTDGAMRWIESWGRLLPDDDGPPDLVGVYADITERRLADQSKEALLAREHRARLEAEEARERLALLADAGERLSASLDPGVILAALPDLCVPGLADVCLIEHVAADGSLTEVGAKSRDAGRLDDLRALRARRAAVGDMGGLWSIHDLVARGEPAMIEEITSDHLRAAAADEQHLELFERLGARSGLAVPLVARGRVLGIVSMFTYRANRAFDADHLALVEELASRAAMALDNALLFESRNRVSRSLQAALLPPALPKIDFLCLAARYEVADRDIEIGGDFYDVMELNDGAWAVVVGDVCGRGPEAAGLTGLMRHSVRAAAVHERTPSGVLAHTNAAVIDQIDESRFCTASLLRLEAGDRPGDPVRVQASSAGHPRPVILRADGRVQLIDCAGMLLGVVPAPTLIDEELTMAPGDTVLMYTDGVTEARQQGDLFGDERLLETLAPLGGRRVEEIVAGLGDAVDRFRDDSNDDVVIIAAQVPTALHH